MTGKSGGREGTVHSKGLESYPDALTGELGVATDLFLNGHYLVTNSIQLDTIQSESLTAILGMNHVNVLSRKR